MVSALDVRSGGQWFEPGLCHRVVSLDKKLKFIIPHSLFFTQVHTCKWVPAIILLGETLQWTGIPSTGSSNILSHFML